MGKYIDESGLLYQNNLLKGEFDKKVNAEAGKGLSANDYTTEEKTKLQGIETGAQVNVKPDWNAVAGSSSEILNKPTKVSQFTNDAGYITGADVPEGAAASNTPPKMDGVQTVGTETAFARGDHVHPSDTSRVPATRKINLKTLNNDITLTAADVGAVSNTIKINTKPLTGDVTLTATDVGALPTGTTAADIGAIPDTLKGQPNGVATLDGDGLIPSTQLPSYVDDVVEGYLYNNVFYKEEAHTTVIEAMGGRIYLDIPTNISYRWGGTTYIQITSTDMVAMENAEILSIFNEVFGG